MNKLYTICLLASLLLAATANYGEWTETKQFQGQLTGSNQNLLNLAREAVEKRFNLGSNGLTFTGLEQTFQKVVAGMEYKFVLGYGSEANTPSQSYEVVVLSQPWLNVSEVVTVEKKHAARTLQAGAVGSPT